MKIINFKNEPPLTEFAPVYDYIMLDHHLSGIDNEKLSEIILQKENEILEQTMPVEKTSPDGYTGLGENSLTSRYTRFNLLSWKYPCIIELKEAIHEIYLQFLDFKRVDRRKVWISCWANVLRKGESIDPHIHCVDEYTYLSGNYVVQAGDTKTIYINPINQINEPATYESINTPGNIMLFQSNIPHYTSTHNHHLPRITIAFDIIVDDLPTTPNLILFDGV